MEHVLEPLCGYLLLAESLWRDGKRFAEAWNFGPPPSDIVPVSQLADRLHFALGRPGARWVATQQHEPHEAGFLALEAAKARAALNWMPRLTLDDTLSWSIAWYKAHHDGHSVTAALINRDIEAYEARGIAAGG